MQPRTYFDPAKRDLVTMEPCGHKGRFMLLTQAGEPLGRPGSAYDLNRLAAYLGLRPVTAH